MTSISARRTRFLPLAAVIAIALVFIALNYRAYDGFFQDDEIDNISWAPYVGAGEFASAFVTPLFLANNFRPAGHLYFTAMGKWFGEDFPPYMTPIFALHLLNGWLVFALIRRLKVPVWHALAAAAFFLLSAAAFDAYWKPMYVFDLLCTAFSLASILLYSHRRWVLSFAAFWLAYKSKEPAVMLPVVLLVWEHWFGERKYLRLAPFLLASLSFGVQGLMRNPNKANDYTFHFTWRALGATIPFYARRFLLFRGSGLLLAGLFFIRDRRIWFGLIAGACFIFPLLFLPGRLFEAYFYLPLACATLGLAAAASRVSPVWAWAALLVWMPFNVHDLLKEQRVKLAADDEAYVFVETLNRWVAQHREIGTLVYNRPPGVYHQWGVGGAWSIAHRAVDSPAYYANSPEGKAAMKREVTAYGAWDEAAIRLDLKARAPGP